MTDRLWKINIDPYDQVIALTQHMINNGISNLYTRLETGEIVDSAKMPQPVSEYADENNYVENVVFGPPTVMVMADFSNVRNVELGLHLKSGNAQLRKFFPPDPKTNSKANFQVWNVDIDKWTIKIPVDVGFVKIDEKTPRGKAIVARSAAKNKPDSSIYELLMDLSTMKSGNAKWDIGNWNDDDWLVNKDKTKVRPKGWELGKARDINDFDEDFRTTLEFNITKLAPHLQEANMTSLGFAVMAKDANKRATFEVNNARYMTYPWINPETRVPATPSLDGDGRLNYLLYLETVADHKPPDETQSSAVLNTHMGNWTDGRNPGTDAPTKFGTFVLSASNFMEKYLLPKFQPINRIMTMDIRDVTAWCEDHTFSYKWKVTATYALNNGLKQGDVSQDGTTFRFTKSPLGVVETWHPDAKTFLLPLTLGQVSGGNYWTYSSIQWGDTARHAYKHDGSVEVWSSGDTITFARLYTVAGHNEIIYEGRTWTKFEYTIDPDILDPNVHGALICKAQWSIKLTMTEVLDGGIQFAIDNVRPTIEVNPWGVSSMYDGEEKWLRSIYATTASNFDYFISNVSNSLQGAEKFTLPASGVYYFKNPIMDSRASLVCELEYNGNPKLGAINSGAQAREPIAEGTWTDIPVARLISHSA